MESKMTTPRPVALIILDGWGYSPERRGNAIRLALSLFGYAEAAELARSG